MTTNRARQMMTAMVVVGAALLTACVPPPPPPTTPSAPVISSFVVKGAPGAAPSLVALAWTVSDRDGGPLSCAIDSNGDGTTDVTIENCGGSGSRNVTYPVAGTFAAQLRVTDPTERTTTSTRIVNVSVGTTETFDIQLRGTGSMTAPQLGAFSQAESYWESAIVRGVPDLSLGPRPGCLPSSSPDLPAVVDDLIIDVAIVPIDGVGDILGQAGPTCYSTANQLAIHGVMEFDSADVDAMIAAGSFDQVILHEMGHVLGFGTLWDTTVFGGSRKLILGAGGNNPVYNGPRAVAEYAALGATGDVPVENQGEPGTRDAHWRESRFDAELMTGYIDAGSNPASRMTIASLADLGYRVSLDVAQPYSLPLAGARIGAASADPDGTMLRPTPRPA